MGWGLRPPYAYAIPPTQMRINFGAERSISKRFDDSRQINIVAACPFKNSKRQVKQSSFGTFVTLRVASSNTSGNGGGAGDIH